MGGALVALPLFLMSLPSSFFDEGDSVCLSVLLFDTTCGGCGLTRAYMHLMHFELAEAWNYNKLSFFSLPFIALYWLQLVADYLFDRKILRRF